MADSVKGITNTQPNTLVTLQYTDKEMWSRATEFAYKRLSSHSFVVITQWKINDIPKAVLLSNYNVRARRISATYARFYLETEQGGDEAKKGRFYWMALAAFAAKTVACTLEDLRVSLMPPRLDQVGEGLGRGNFWLFCDIAPWHWMQANHPDVMQQYEATRSDTHLVPAIAQATKQMPWSAYSLPKIGHLKTTPKITEAFALVRQIEGIGVNDKKRPGIQLDHLMAIAEHEQKEVLQPLIYEDGDFIWWLKVQRSYFGKLLAPTLQLVFASTCDTDKDEYKSVAPEDIVLEDYTSRMNWIGAAAKKFHDLMQTEAPYMEGQLQTMASWVTLDDKPLIVPGL